MGAGMPEPGPGQHQERLGGGRQTSDRRRLRHRLEKLGGALQKARSPRRQVRRKILRNKHPPSSNRCHFIHTFAFVCIHTSYMHHGRFFFNPKPTFFRLPECDFSFFPEMPRHTTCPPFWPLMYVFYYLGFLFPLSFSTSFFCSDSVSFSCPFTF
jgi:hypothetical protein